MSAEEPRHIWQQIEALLSGATTRVLLIAPFVKRDILQKSLAIVPQHVPEIHCITRWSPAEVAAGVSDPEIIELTAADPRLTVSLCPALHAKLFLADHRCLAGSANLTGKATGLVPDPNIELLIETEATHPEVQRLLSTVEARKAAATGDLAALMREQAKLLQKEGAVRVPDADSGSLRPWLPSTRRPERLYRAYTGAGQLPGASRESAIRDLAHLDLPAGLTEEEFNDGVRSRLRAIPELSDILDQKRMRREDLLSLISQSGRSEEEALLATETIAAWLVHFGTFFLSYDQWELRQGREIH